METHDYRRAAVRYWRQKASEAIASAQDEKNAGFVQKLNQLTEKN